MRPGTIYADPYGHVLVLVKRVPQTGDGAGVFLAVDGQPDGTVARKRFWRGNFLFAQDPALGSPGFKRFRPIVREKSGSLAPPDQRRDREEPGLRRFLARSVEALGRRLLRPHGRRDVAGAARSGARAEGGDHRARGAGERARGVGRERAQVSRSEGGGEVDMPDGASIFETTGAWEDFATPSRDLRLLIAIDVVRGFPDRVARRPERYAMPKGKSAADVKAELEATLASELAARKFSYTRTDGSQWTLALKDVLDRTSALEMAYNLNDCVELRWGAAEDSEEASTCKRRAPAAQRTKMASNTAPGSTSAAARRGVRIQTRRVTPCRAPWRDR